MDRVKCLDSYAILLFGGSQLVGPTTAFHKAKTQFCLLSLGWVGRDMLWVYSEKKQGTLINHTAIHRTEACDEEEL